MVLNHYNYENKNDEDVKQAPKERISPTLDLLRTFFFFYFMCPAQWSRGLRHPAWASCWFESHGVRFSHGITDSVWDGANPTS